MAQNKKKSKAKGKGKQPAVKNAGKAAKKSSATATAAAAADAAPAIVEAGALAAPGDVLGQTATHKCGPGTFARDGVIVASLAGTVRINNDVIETIREGRRPDIAVGVEVIGVVTRTNRTNALLDLVAAGGAALDFPARATLRREDALPPGRDASNLDLTAQFAGRDLVRAVVVAVDDAARYHVSVAAEGMGLVRSGA